MGKKVYAIKEGYDSKSNKKIENLIVSTWNECLEYVKGVKGAKYKSFESVEEAKAFLDEKVKLLKKGIDQYPLDKLHAYVDGSYNVETGKYSYAMVIVKDNVIMHIENGAAEDDSKKDIRQIAGELRGAVRAVEYAAANNEKEIVLFHDYEGICHHATGYWERRDESSKEYYEKINNLMKKNNIDVIFVKVDSHTGDLFNEVADEEAKSAAELTINGVVEKWLKTNKIQVKNKNVMEKLLEIIPNKNQGNIVVSDKCTNNYEEIEETNVVIKAIQDITKLNDDAVELYISNLENDLKNRIILEFIKGIKSDKI